MCGDGIQTPQQMEINHFISFIAAGQSSSAAITGASLTSLHGTYFLFYFRGGETIHVGKK